MKKGFTLIEVLGVISILGVIALIAMPSVDYVVNQGKEKAYNTQIDSIKLAIENYITENKISLGNEYNLSISLEDLKNEGYLDFDFRNPNNNKCFKNDNNFLVTKKKDEKVKYKIDNVIEGNEEDCGSFESYPSILLNESNFIELNLGDEFIEPGYIARNSEGKDINDNVIVTGEVDINTPGVYKLVYTVTYNELSATKIRTIKVVDNTPPEFVYYENRILMTEVDEFDLLDCVQVEDNYNEDIQISTTTNLVLGIVGSYYINYVAKDSSNNVSTQKVNVVIMDATPTDESYFTFENGVITDYQYNAPKNVVIPDTINGQTVHTIGEDAFDHTTTVTSVIIPDSVTKIEDDAFYANELKFVYLPNSITHIGDNAFSRNKIEIANLPNELTFLGGYSFNQNKISALKIPNTLTTIEENAFSENDISMLALHDNITSIEKEAFNDNSLPDNKAFIYKRNSDGSKDYSRLVSYGGKNTKAIIPDSVTHINEQAFFECDHLTEVVFHDKVEYIGKQAFQRTKLKKVEIPPLVTTINMETFWMCELEEVKFNNDLETIGSLAFSDNHLRTISLPTNLKTIDRGAFSDNVLDYLWLSKNLETIGEDAFRNNEMRFVDITDSVTFIDTGAFLDNEPLEELSVKRQKYADLAPYDWYDVDNVSISYKSDGNVN